MNAISMIKTFRRYTWGALWRKIRSSPHYPKLFKSYWHCRFSSPRTDLSGESLYLSGRPNPGAGIGHQMANWIAGYWWAGQFGVNFAHSSFSSPAWERFLGLGENEATVEELTSKHGHQVVKLPPFREKDRTQRELVERIIASYRGRKVVFLLHQDQSYADQCGLIGLLQHKFHNAPARQQDKLLFSKDDFNIAVHVRRGDIVAGQKTGNINHQMRWQDNQYFRRVLSNVLKILETRKPVAIYLFSQGTPEDFKEFEDFDDLHLCLDMGAQDSFLHMVFADLLITSKSSFSYKPALLSKGIRVCPSDFWHGYPSDSLWITAHPDGSLATRSIKADPGVLGS